MHAQQADTMDRSIHEKWWRETEMKRNEKQQILYVVRVWSAERRNRVDADTVAVCNVIYRVSVYVVCVSAREMMASEEVLSVPCRQHSLCNLDKNEWKVPTKKQRAGLLSPKTN